MYDVKPDRVGWTVCNAETGQPSVLDGVTLTELEYEAADVLACLLNRSVYGARQKPLSRWVLSGLAPASIARAGMKLIRGHAASMMASTVAVLRRWANLRQSAGTYWLRRERGRRTLRSSS